MIKFNIKDLRTKKGISQVELAKRINVHRVQVSRWENGTYSPSIEKLCEIANALKITLDELVEYKEIQGKISDQYLDMMKEKEDE
ncbi:MAG: helix-turn-helix transcriptional regulator [Acholeplasmataceae bacterium]